LRESTPGVGSARWSNAHRILSQPGALAELQAALDLKMTLKIKASQFTSAFGDWIVRGWIENAPPVLKPVGKKFLAEWEQRNDGSIEQLAQLDTGVAPIAVYYDVNWRGAVPWAQAYMQKQPTRPGAYDLAQGWDIVRAYLVKRGQLPATPAARAAAPRFTPVGPADLQTQPNMTPQPPGSRAPSGPSSPLPWWLFVAAAVALG
jgi:hypothetical protein